MEENGHKDNESRLDRIEAAIDFMIRDHEEFRAEHKRLLTAQVVMQDSLVRLGEKMERLTDKFDAVGDKLNALIAWSDQVHRDNNERFKRLEEKH